MATLADLKLMVIRLLGDGVLEQIPEVGEPEPPIAGTQFEAALLLDGIKAGVDAVLPWFPKASIADIACDGTGKVYALPTDCYAIDGVWDVANNSFLDDVFIAPGQISSGSRLASYIEYPLGSVTFTRAPSTDGITLYYSATWEKPSADDDEIELPEIVHQCVALYAASFCTLARASSAANLRQYNTRIDSGTPIQNPIADISQILLRRFESEMNRIMPVRKVQR